MLWLLPLSPALAQEPSPEFDLANVTEPSGPPVGALGASSFTENCAPCHGLQGMGDGPSAAELPSPPAAFADPAVIWELSPAMLFHTTKFGRIEKLMPPWQNRLNDEEIWNTLAYVWSLHTSQSEVGRGIDPYVGSCAACHGLTGAGDGPAAETALSDWSNPALTMVSSQAQWEAGWLAAHPEIGGNWSAVERRQVLEYMRTFSIIPPWESPYRPGSGAIRGQAIVGTPGTGDVAGLEITLQAFMDFAPVATFTTTVATDGLFEFTGLSTTSGVVYLASLTFKEIAYSTPLLFLTGDNPEAETDLTVYDITDDPSVVTIDRAHWILDSQPGALVVGEIMAFGNTSDRAYTGIMVDGINEPVSISVYVPPDAEELTFDNGILGERFQRIGDRVYDTAPLLPGEATKQIIMRYALIYDGDKADLTQEFFYPIKEINLLVAKIADLQVEVSGLTQGPEQDIQGQNYLIWQGSDLSPQTISVGLTGLIQAGDVDPRSFESAPGDGSAARTSARVTVMEPWMPWTIGGALALALAGVFFWGWRKQTTRPRRPKSEWAAQREALVRRIARLDDLHALGELESQSWQQQRARLKAELISVTNQLQE